MSEGSSLSVEQLIEKLPEIGQSIKNGASLSDELQKLGLSGVYFKEQTEMPVEDILSIHSENLKEHVLKYGFDANDSESVRGVVKVAADYWNHDRKESYLKQLLDSAESGFRYFSLQPWSKQLEILKNEDKIYQKISSRMLKDVYIGQNTTVDLSGCRDLLDTMSAEEARRQIGIRNDSIPRDKCESEENDIGRISVISYEEMKAVDEYLTSKGLKTDEEKSEYMACYLEGMALRTGKNADAGLTKILMSYNPNIIYPDGVAVEYKADGMITASSNGDYFDVTSLQTLAQYNPFAGKEGEKTNEPVSTPQQFTPVELYGRRRGGR